MNYLSRPLGVISVFLLTIALLLSFIGQNLFDVFMHNFLLNILIFGVFFVGLFLFIYQIIQLRIDYSWLDAFEQNQAKHLHMVHSSILQPIVTGFNNHTIQESFALKSALSSVEQRLEDKREFNRYIIGLCVFLGLVGTFWGLSKTITAIAGVINGIDINAKDITDAFQNLKVGLQAPLQGMGYAFSSSLFGLSTSLILGFIDLQASKSFSNFYNHVEEVLSTHVEPLKKASKNYGPVYTEAMLQQLCENLSSFQTHLERTEENRSQMATFMQSFLGNLARLDDVLHRNLQHMENVSQQHLVLQQQMEALIRHQNSEKSINSLKSIDVTLQTLLSEFSKNNKLSTEELKKEIRFVAKTVSALKLN